jgi:hypothetical protein
MRRNTEPARTLYVTGAVAPTPRRVTLQKRVGSKWTTVGHGRTSKRGRYALLVDSTGTYRVLANGGVGPAVRVR